MTTMRTDPFTTDGIQTVAVYVHGWSGPYSETFQTARKARAWLDEQMDEWRRFTDHMDVSYYGYDPNVYNDDGTVLGTDGYPDYTTCITDLDDTVVDSIEWEQA